MTAIRSSSSNTNVNTTTSASMETSSSSDQTLPMMQSSSPPGGLSPPDIKLEPTDSSQMSQDSPMKLPQTESFLESLGQPLLGPPLLTQPSTSAGTPMYPPGPGTTPYRFPASGAPIKMSSPNTQVSEWLWVFFKFHLKTKGDVRTCF